MAVGGDHWTCSRWTRSVAAQWLVAVSRRDCGGDPVAPAVYRVLLLAVVGFESFGCETARSAHGVRGSALPCLYDLSGGEDVQACPECGTAYIQESLSDSRSAYRVTMSGPERDVFERVLRALCVRLCALCGPPLGSRQGELQPPPRLRQQLLRFGGVHAPPLHHHRLLHAPARAIEQRERFIARETGEC